MSACGFEAWLEISRDSVMASTFCGGLQEVMRRLHASKAQHGWKWVIVEKRMRGQDD
jgi:hypothetical protein